MLFRDVVGQEPVKQQLIQSFQEGRISHALMFHGQEGSGNLALAIAFARYLACPHRTETDACGMCPTCQKFNSMQFADLHFSFPFWNIKPRTDSEPFQSNWREMLLEGVSDKRGTKRWESAYIRFEDWKLRLGEPNKPYLISTYESLNVIKKISLKSYEGGYKTVIVWLPEHLNTYAANRLLKTIEEPPDNTLLFFVSNHPDQIISTILSRVQRIKVPKLSDEAIRAALITHLGVTSNEKADEITRVVDGNYARAIQMAKVAEVSALYDDFSEWMRNCYKRDVAALVDYADDMHKRGRETARKFLEYALHMVRQCIVMNYAGEDLARFSAAERAFAGKFAPFINDLNVVEIATLLEEAHLDISRNAYMKLVFLDLSMNIHSLLRRQ